MFVSQLRVLTAKEKQYKTYFHHAKMSTFHHLSMPLPHSALATIATLHQRVNYAKTLEHRKRNRGYHVSMSALSVITTPQTHRHTHTNAPVERRTNPAGCSLFWCKNGLFPQKVRIALELCSIFVYLYTLCYNT